MFLLSGILGKIVSIIVIVLVPTFLVFSYFGILDQGRREYELEKTPIWVKLAFSLVACGLMYLTTVIPIIMGIISTLGIIACILMAVVFSVSDFRVRAFSSAGILSSIMLGRSLSAIQKNNRFPTSLVMAFVLVVMFLLIGRFCHGSFERKERAEELVEGAKSGEVEKEVVITAAVVAAAIIIVIILL